MSSVHNRGFVYVVGGCCRKVFAVECGDMWEGFCDGGDGLSVCVSAV